MLRRLGSGTLAAMVAALTCVGLLATSGTAVAVEPVDDRITLVDAFKDALINPGAMTDYIIGDLNQNGEYDAQENPISMPWLGAMMAAVGGTPAQVQSGEKLVAKGCKTGYGCVVAGAGVLLGIGALDQWGPDGVFGNYGQTDENFAGATAPVPEPQYYNSVRENACTGTKLSRMSWTELSNWRLECTPAIPSGGYAATIGWAADLVRISDGEWIHITEGMGYTINSYDAVAGRDPFPVGGAANQGAYEIRRVHINRSSVGWTQFDPGMDKGVWWGQNLLNPAADLESLTRCQRPDNSTYDVVVSNPLQSGLSAVPPCNPGDTPVYTQQTVVNPDGSREVQSTQRYDTTIGAEQFPLCVANGCQLLIKAAGVPCSVGMAACVDWSRDKSDKTCWYGPYQLPLSLCNPLERAYQHPAETPVPATTPNIDGNPDTHEGPLPQLQPTATPTPTTTTTTQPSPTSSVQPTTTPNTDPTTRPSPTSTTTTSASASPSGTTSPSPSPPPDTSGAPNPEDQAGTRCFPSGWASFNPVQWVYMPVMCALRDAFVPDPTLTTTRLDVVRSKLDTKGPGPAIAQVSTLIDSIPAASGCQGPGMTINLAGTSRTLYLFNACTEPMSTAAGYSYALATVVLVIGGGLSVVRAIASAFGLNVSLGRGARDGD